MKQYSNDVILRVIFCMVCAHGAVASAQRKTANQGLVEVMNAYKANASYAEMLKLSRLGYLSASDNDKAEYCIKVANFLLSHNAGQYANVVIDLCDKGLALEKGIENRVDLLETKGNALESICVTSKNTVDAKSWENAVTAYLTAINEVAKNKKEEARISIPAVMMLNYDGPDDSQAYKNALKSVSDQRQRREYVMLQNKLVRRYEMLLKAIQRTRAASGISKERLKALAEPVFENRQLLEKTLDQIN